MKLRKLSAALVLILTLAFAGSAQAMILGFDFGINDAGQMAISNTSTNPSISIVSLTVSFINGNLTNYSGAPIANGGGVAATNLPTSAGGAQTFTITYGTNFTGGTFSQILADLDWNFGSGTDGVTWGAGKTFVEVYYSNGYYQQADVLAPGITIGGTTYDNMAMASNTVTPIPPAFLLLGSGLLGLAGYRRMKG